MSARYDQTDNSPCRGGHADVWKGEYRGQDVAVKVLRTYSNRELEKMINVGCVLRSISVPLLTTIRGTEVLQGGCDVEISSTPKYLTTSRGDDVKKYVRDGLKLDAKRRY